MTSTPSNWRLQVEKKFEDFSLFLINHRSYKRGKLSSKCS